MKTKKPATHTGTLAEFHYEGLSAFAIKPGTSRTVQLVKHKSTYEDKATGQKYSQFSGGVRPANKWDSRYLDPASVKPIDPTNGS